MTISRPRRREKAYLPDTIMEQILLKLPIESLVRFESVSKHWFSLISHPSFVQSHLNHVLSNEKIMTFIPSSSEFSVLKLDDGKIIVQRHKYSLPCQVEARGRGRGRVHLMGSCNGLICLGIYTKSRFSQSDGFNPILWNPLLNDYKQVPFLVPTFMNRFGFGYDSRTLDYKLVRIDNFKDTAEVYGLKSNSIRVIPFVFEHLGIRPGCVFRNKIGLYMTNLIGIYMNGSLYWLHSTRSSEFGFIVFNLRYENFRFLKFPNNIYTLPIRNAKFSTIVRDCQLDVFFYDPKKKFFNLVTMKEDSRNGRISWSSINVQNPSLGKLQCWPICLMMNGDIVMNIKYDESLYLRQSPRGRGLVVQDLVRRNWGPGYQKKRKYDESPSLENYHRIIYNPEQRTVEYIAMMHEGAEDLRAEYTTYIETLILPSNLINCSAP